MAWRVFATCWLVYTAFWTPFLLREHFPVLSLIESGSLNVERYVGWSDDIFRGANGGAYINNNPGASLTAAVPLFLLRPVLQRVEEWNRKLPRLQPPANDNELVGRMLQEGRAFYFLLVAFLCVALVMAPATAGVAAYFCSRLAEAGVPPARAAQAALLYGLGTPVLFRAEHLNHNLLVCDAGFAALLLLWDPAPLRKGIWGLGSGGWGCVARSARVRASLTTPLTLRAAGAGLLAGYAVLCDYSGVVVVAITALYVWLRSRDGASEASPTQPQPPDPSPQIPFSRGAVFAAYAAGVSIGLAALVIYQTWAFGSPYHPSQHYMTPTAPTVRGYRGFDWPSPSLLRANFFDPRFGLFAYCPALLLAFAAPFVRRVRYRVASREMTVLFSYFLLFILFCAANQYSWLQPSTGFRYLVPVVPALALLALHAAQALPSPIRHVLAAAACCQTFLMTAGYENNFLQAVRTLWHRHFKLAWMIRMGQIGVPVNGYWPPALFLGLGLAVAAVWLTGGPNSLENKPFFFTRAAAREVRR